MTPAAASIPECLVREAPASALPLSGDELNGFTDRMLRARERFGVTRVGSLTGLDRTGIPVMQAVRPLALSNAVSQGKGLTSAAAALSALMESVETWAAERMGEAPVRVFTAREADLEAVALFGSWVPFAHEREWPTAGIPWIEGWDWLAGRTRWVPLALVDTDYRWPSRHPPYFPRTTTGLGAGRSLSAAVVQAGLEILERHALARSRHVPYFFERHQLDLSTAGSGPVAQVLRQLRERGLIVGAWRCPETHNLPVYRCHVMEGEWPLELAPFPAEGSACRLTADEALLAALLEACQGRAAAIAGSREDITRRMYPSQHDRVQLLHWRDQLLAAGPVAHDSAGEATVIAGSAVDAVRSALIRAGAQAIVVVPLFEDRDLGLHVVRLVAPPLQLVAGGAHG